MASAPCIDCFHYDPIIRGKQQGRHGRCATQSVYPAEAQAGQIFPADVQRAAPGERALPVIVVGSDTVATCTLFRAKPTPPRK